MRNIVLSCDENYVLPTRVMLRSMAENNAGGDWKIWFVYSRVSDAGIALLRAQVESCGWAFAPLKLDRDYEKLFAEFPVQEQYSRETYYRLLLPWIMEEDKALYLDVDMMVRGSLKPLYDTVLKDGELIAAVPDPGKGVNEAKRKEYHLQGDYCNAGVLLMDLKRIREWSTAESFVQKILTLKNTVRLEYSDQDLLNLLYDGKIRTLDERYNFAAPWNMERYILRPLYRRKVVVAHFLAKPKPWEKGYFGFFGREYRSYLKELQK